VKTKRHKRTAQFVNVFNPYRYPVVKAIVDGGADSAQSLADKVGEQILKQIISNKLPAGTPLTTVALAQSLGVSRTPVAKALAKLAADGILLQPNNQNALVCAEASNWLVQCRQLRNILEPEAVTCAAGRVDAQVLDDLWSLSREAKPDTNFDWTPAAIFFDAALHLSIAEFCGNLPMKVSIRRCWTYKRLAYGMYPLSKAQLKPEYEQHVAILRALAAGDGEGAWKAMTKHLQAAWREQHRDRRVSS
jgi:DNA-binding GntR family transcriptional regulator